MRRDDESLSAEDVSEDNVKIYSNPLFEFDDEYISSDVNPLFNEVLEDIECKDSYDPNLDKLTFLVAPLSDANDDECFDSRGDVDEINDFENGYYNSEGDILYLESLLSDDTIPNLPSEVFLDRDLRCLSDAPIDNLMSEDKNFEPGIYHSALKYLLSKQDAKPRAIINDRGTYFYNDKFAKVMSKYGVTHRLATAYHPQTSGQVEVSNQDTHWVYSLQVPIELEHKTYWALKHVNFDLKTTGDHRKLQLNELNELRDQAYENSLIYKKKTKKLHDSKIKNRTFNVGDWVLLFNSHLKIFPGKLKTRWSGPFTITKAFPYGTVELSQPDGPNFKVNGHHVKHYFGGDVPQLVVPDL
nr:reverse transcriptase domain-containing protein [Tanacetum cinerariifolium]